MLLLLFLMQVLTVFSYTNFLTPTQLYSIKNILNNPASTHNMKYKIKQIFYQHYYHWSISKAYEFSKKYRYYKNLNPHELSLYAGIGLEQAINTYNSSYPFFNHLELYVRSSLFNGISELQPINSIPKNCRKSKKWRSENHKNYERMLNTQFVGFDEWIFDKYNKNSENINSCKITEIREFMNLLDPISKKIMNLKYFQNDKLSNKRIGELLEFSEETVRLRLKKIHKNILLKYYTDQK
jgi:RNA polymerase sigma factor (sigma-70 family)